jgi:hypothetical protein
MFSSFSWTNYLLFTAIVLVIYALIILGLYYRREMNKLFFSRSEALQDMIDRPVAALSDPMRMVHELVSELGQLIRDAAENETIQAELFFSLHQLIKNYLILRPTEFKGRINQYIRDELEIRGLHGLSLEQYEALWKD